MAKKGRMYKSSKFISAIFLLFIISASVASALAEPQTSTTVTSTGNIIYWPRVDVTVNPTQIIGTNNLSLGFMLDHEWNTFRNRPVLQELAEDTNFKLVRIFDWKSSSPDPCVYWNEETKTGTFDWTNVDSLVNKIFEIGAEPIFSLGNGDMRTSYLPSGMATNPDTGLPYPDNWAAYCRAWVEHFEAVGLPVRFYEVVNEATFYWYPNWNYDATKLGYFLELFNTAYDEMHEANPEILISNDAATYRKFIDYWILHGGKLDYISFHKYDCDGVSMGDETPLVRAENRHFVTDSIWYGVNDVRQLWFNEHGITLPAINSESNFAATCSEGTDPRIQQVVGTVWNALTLRSCILNDVQYMIYYSLGSSASWEQTKPTGGLGFGMINLDDNEPWYPYYLQKLFGDNLRLGDQLVATTSTSTDIRSLAWFNSGTLNILLIAKVDQPRSIVLNGITGEANFFKIDNVVSHLTPSVQTGNIDLGLSLDTIGYTVVLIQVTS